MVNLKLDSYVGYTSAAVVVKQHIGAIRRRPELAG